MEYIRKYWYVLVCAACVTVLGVIYMGRDTSPPVVHGPERTALSAHAEYPAEPIPDKIAEIVVHIEGEVNEPGVFTLPYGSRVNDVLALAGGATEYADLARINLAAFLRDAQQVIIPAIGGEYELPARQSATDESGLININTADARLLETLPGIGSVRAGNIIAHREAQGPFSAVDQLINVPNIGSLTLEGIRNLVTID